MKLVLATGNRGKLREMRSILSAHDIAVVPIGDVVPGFDVEESGATFAANARLKARAGYEATGLPCAADDSGLCVVGLSGEPGVRSARYAGPGKSDADRTAYLLSRMERMEADARRAWFACALYAVVPAHWVDPAAAAEVLPEEGIAGVEMVGILIEGRLNGSIGRSERGDKGFGYDPVFRPDADPDRSLAEFSLEEKNAISHRGLAFLRFSEVLRSS